MDEIKAKEPGAFEIFQAAQIDENTLLEINKDDLLELFQGAENFLLRRRLWKIIQKCKENDAEIENAFLFPKKTLNVLSNHMPSLPSMSTESSQSSTTASPTSSPCSSPSISFKSESSASHRAGQGKEHVFKPESSPAFIMYSDSEITHASEKHVMSKDLFDKLIRNTVSNMRSACNNLDPPREPTNLELQDMAKALCRKYPCVGRVRSQDGKSFVPISSEDISKLTETQKEEFHHYVFTRLKKRRSNVIPTRKPQGKVPARSNKRIKLNLPEPIQTKQTAPASEKPLAKEGVNSSGSEIEDADIADRHYLALDKEQRKSKPKASVINKYLNLDFPARRKLLKSTKKENRPNVVFESYPCFKDPSEVVEEVRRTLELPESQSPDEYIKRCVKNMERNIDTIIYYGISKGTIKPPRSSSVDQKMIHLLKGINLVFKTKAKQQKDDIVHFIEDDEEPDSWQQKRQGCVPGLVVSRNIGAMVLIGKQIFLSFKEGDIIQAVVAFVATFYLLDLDYPAKWLLSLSVLQKIIFNDNQMHPDCAIEVKKTLDEMEII